MDNEGSFEEKIQVLITKAESQRQEAHERYERELQQALEAVDQRIEHYVCTLNDYLAENGLPTMQATPPWQSALIERLKDASYRQMLSIWADDHDGLVVMRELINAVTEAGIFDKRNKAHRSLYSAVSVAKKKGTFERVSDGVYQKCPIPWTDEQREERGNQAESFRKMHNLPSPTASSPHVYTEPNMGPARRQAQSTIRY